MRRDSAEERRAWKDEGSSGSAGPWGKRDVEMLRLRSSSEGLWYAGVERVGFVGLGVERSHENLLVEEVRFTFLGCEDCFGVVIVVSGEDEVVVVLFVSLVERELPGKMLDIISSSSSSDSNSLSVWSWRETPRLTGAEAPLNQFCSAFAPAANLGGDDGEVVLSGPPREEMKLARDLVGEGRAAALEVC